MPELIYSFIIIDHKNKKGIRGSLVFILIFVQICIVAASSSTDGGAMSFGRMACSKS